MSTLDTDGTNEPLSRFSNLLLVPFLREAAHRTATSPTAPKNRSWHSSPFISLAILKLALQVEAVLCPINSDRDFLCDVVHDRRILGPA